MKSGEGGAKNQLSMWTDRQSPRKPQPGEEAARKNLGQGGYFHPITSNKVGRKSYMRASVKLDKFQIHIELQEFLEKLS